MNGVSFRDPVCYICHVGIVVASFPPAREMIGSNPFTLTTNNLVIDFSEFIKTFKEKSNVKNLFQMTHQK